MRRHEGSEGCRAAQDRRGISGCAGEMRGARAARETGRVVVGKRMGEVKDGQRRREIWASASTRVSVEGQGVSGEEVGGRDLM